MEGVQTKYYQNVLETLHLHKDLLQKHQRAPHSSIKISQKTSKQTLEENITQITDIEKFQKEFS